MEVVSRLHETDNPCSPTSHSSSNIIQTPPSTPKPVSRTDQSPYPTTFIQADTNNFKQVVQLLTGSSNPTQQADVTPGKVSIPLVKTGQQKKQGNKLYERRNSLKNGLMINPNLHSGSRFGHGLSPRFREVLSPSVLDFPALVLSPVTPLIEDRFSININKTSSLVGSYYSEEDRAIAEKGFYLHPSPRAVVEPELLPLFPVTSPRVTGLTE